MCKESKTTAIFFENWQSIREKISDFLPELQDDKDSPRNQMAKIFAMASSISRFLKSMDEYITEQVVFDLVHIDRNRAWFKEYKAARGNIISIKKYIKTINLVKRECHYTKYEWYNPSLDKISADLLAQGRDIVDAFVHITNVMHKMATKLRDLRENEVSDSTLDADDVCLAAAGPAPEPLHIVIDNLSGLMAKPAVTRPESYTRQVMRYRMAGTPEGNRRLQTLYEALRKKHIITEQTLMDDFLHFFYGEDCDARIYWTFAIDEDKQKSAKAALKYFFCELGNRGLVTATDENMKWVIVTSHFVQADGSFYANDQVRVSKDPKRLMPLIDSLVDILDWNLELDIDQVEELFNDIRYC